MWLYFLRASRAAGRVVALAVTLLDLMLHLIPGDPAVMILGPACDAGADCEDPHEMGLDQPSVLQILTFFGDLLRGDMGVDVFTGAAGVDDRPEQLPYTLVLIAVSIGWAIAIGHPSGLLFARSAATPSSTS